MTPATITPPPAATAAPPMPAISPPLRQSGGWEPYRWTISAYRELGKTGLFEDMKTMLIDGEIFTMAMPNPPHDEALNLTQDFLRATFVLGHHVRNQQGFDIGNRTDPGPDLAVVPGTIREWTGRTPNTAVLVVDVADSSLFTDTTTKAEKYATAGVPDYWVLDVENRRLLVYRDPESLPEGLGATAYRTHLAFQPHEPVAPLAAPTSAVKVANLLP